MAAVLSIIKPVFWGLVTLSVLVFVHEGGHFLAARACGVRVTEFFLGLPCRYNLHHVSRRIGTKFGITPLLLGGYAAICGMDPTDVDCAPEFLAAVHRHGRVSVDTLARELSVSTDEALDACAVLCGWGSIVPVYDAEKGESPQSGYYPSTYAAAARDARGFTLLDGRKFDRSSATHEGDPWPLFSNASSFYQQEKSATYIGQGFLKRAFMLLAGILVNILVGVILMMSVYSIVGVSAAVDSNVIGSIEAGSVAEKAGLCAGDTVVDIAGTRVSSWTTLVHAIDEQGPSASFELSYKHGDRLKTAHVTLGKNGKLGIAAQVETVRLSPVRSFQVSCDYIAATAQGVANLLVPQHTKEILDNSTSIVGISVMSSQAAEAGVASYLTFAALISLSLGFMNLLPIPPLDGGKLVIEAIQAVLHRELSLKVQNIVSLVGVGLFVILFLYMLRADIVRFIL